MLESCVICTSPHRAIVASMIECAALPVEIAKTLSLDLTAIEIHIDQCCRGSECSEKTDEMMSANNSKSRHGTASSKTPENPAHPALSSWAVNQKLEKLEQNYGREQEKMQAEIESSSIGNPRVAAVSYRDYTHRLGWGGHPYR